MATTIYYYKTPQGIPFTRDYQVSPESLIQHHNGSVQITKEEYDQLKANQELINLVKSGEFNTALTTYFQALYRVIDTIGDIVWTSKMGSITKDQARDDIRKLDIFTHYIIAYEGTTDYVPIDTAELDRIITTSIKLEQTYKFRYFAEYPKLAAILKIQQLIEAKEKPANATSIEIIKELMEMKLATHHIDLTGAQIGQGI